MFFKEPFRPFQGLPLKFYKIDLEIVYSKSFPSCRKFVIETNLIPMIFLTKKRRLHMKAGHKITVKIPDEVFKEITDFKKKAHIRDDNAAVSALLKYALTLPPYFKSFDWEKAEKEADAEITAGKTKSFSSVDDFLSDLKT
jgi:hypothetical protein